MRLGPSVQGFAFYSFPICDILNSFATKVVSRGAAKDFHKLRSRNECYTCNNFPAKKLLRTAMTDFLDTDTRSRVMASIRSKWSRIDRKVHGMLKSAKVKHSMYPNLFGSPDVLVRPNLVVFVDGCFWHSCPRCGRPPKSRLEYWAPKMARNRRRDKCVSRLLRKQGWKVLRIWEHEVKSNPRKVLERVVKLIA